MRVYPRACGGTPPAAHAGPGRVGLSPRVRGNLGETLHLGNVVRSIPARAGEPSVSCGSTPAPTVYPRACGGTPRQIDSCYPPLFAKGTRLAVFYQVHAIGIHDLLGRLP